MVYVEVMYKNLSRQVESLEEINKLPKDNVLFILVSTDEIEGKLKNVVSCFGFDHYALCQKRDNNQDWIMLFGWDDDDFAWRQVNCGGCINREVMDVPIGVMHVVFRGGHVEEETWKEAQRIFNEEMA